MKLIKVGPLKSPVRENTIPLTIESCLYGLYNGIKSKNSEYSIRFPLTIYFSREDIGQWSVYGLTVAHPRQLIDLYQIYYQGGIPCFLKLLQNPKDKTLLAGVRNLLRRYRLQPFIPHLGRGFRGDIHTPSILPRHKEDRDWIGIEVECVVPANLEDRQILLAYANKKIWGVSIHNDGSIESPSGGRGREITIIHKRESLDRHIQPFCDVLREIGAYVNTSCGLHVHFDRRHSCREGVAIEANYALKHMSHAQLLLHPSRIRNKYCLPGLSWENRYRQINIAAYERHGTIEVRAHEGTTDPVEIMNWIRLCEFMFKPIKGTALNYRTKMLDWINLIDIPEANKDYWKAKAEKMHPGCLNMTPSQYLNPSPIPTGMRYSSEPVPGDIFDPPPAFRVTPPSWEPPSATTIPTNQHV